MVVRFGKMIIKNLKNGFDFLIIAKKDTNNQEFKIIKESINDLFGRAKVIK